VSEKEEKKIKLERPTYEKRECDIDIDVGKAENAMIDPERRRRSRGEEAETKSNLK
jgi:hypothetical protein